MGHNNYSALSLFVQCERRYWFERVDPARVPPLENMYLQLGILYHELFAAAVNGDPVDFKYLEADIRTRRIPWLTPTPLPALLAELEANLARVRAEIVPWLRNPQVEVKIKGDYVGRLDLIVEETPVTEDGVIVGLEPGKCILDWKTRFSPRRRSGADTYNSPQLAQYCLMSGAKSAGFIEVPRDVNQPLHTVVTTFTDEDLAKWRRYLDAQYAAIAARGPSSAAYRLAAPGDPLCSERFCPHWARCPGGAGV